MQPSLRRWFRNLLLSSIYALGVFGILASSDGDNDFVRAFTCGLSIQGIAPVGDGTVWVGVFAKTNTDTEDRVVLLDTDGSELLSYFIGDGGSENAIRTVALATDGSYVYVGGNFSGGILRLDASSGQLDNSFPVGTGFSNSDPSIFKVTSIVPLADGKVYVGGTFDDYNTGLVSGFVRLENNGILDTGFGGTGATVVTVESIALEAPGFSTNVYSGGTTIPSFSSGIGRWDNLGMEDDQNFFPPNGVSPVSSVAPALDGSGDVYVGGNFANRIIRLANGGTPDNVFDVGSGFDNDVLSIVRTDDMTGDIYVGGSFTTYKDIPANGILRLKDEDGSRDNNFDIGDGFEDPNNVFPFSKVASIALDGTSGVYVGGGFTQYDGTASNGIARLDTVGVLDTAFDVSITIGGEVCDSQTIPQQP